MKIFRQMTLFIVIALAPLISFSQEAERQALTDMKISYTYSDGGAVELTVKGNKLAYLWTAGVFEGTEVAELDYYSREISNSIYLVSWHDSVNLNFVSLIFNFDLMTEHGTAILSYGTPDEVTLFDEARIDSIERL